MLFRSYDGMDVVHHNFDHSSMVVECHEVKRSRDDYNGAGPSGEDCDEELSDRDESNDDLEEDNDDFI